MSASDPAARPSRPAAAALERDVFPWWVPSRSGRSLSAKVRAGEVVTDRELFDLAPLGPGAEAEDLLRAVGVPHEVWDVFHATHGRAGLLQVAAEGGPVVTRRKLYLHRPEGSDHLVGGPGHGATYLALKWSAVQGASAAVATYRAVEDDAVVGLAETALDGAGLEARLAFSHLAARALRVERRRGGPALVVEDGDGRRSLDVPVAGMGLAVDDVLDDVSPIVAAVGLDLGALRGQLGAGRADPLARVAAGQDAAGVPFLTLFHRARHPADGGRPGASPSAP